MALYRRCGCGQKPYEKHTRHVGNWILDYREDGRSGRRIRINLGTEDKRQAEKLKGRILEDMDQGRDPSLRVIKARPWRDVVEEFIEKHVKVNIKPRSRRSYENRAGHILDAFDGHTIQAVTTRAISDYVAGRKAAGVSGATCNRDVAHISKVINWAKRCGYYGGENPAKAVQRAKESGGRVRYLTADEAERLIAHSPDHLKPIVMTALYTGGRKTEALTLERGDINLERGVLYYNQTNTKSGKQREIPIDDRLRPVLEGLLRFGQTARLFTYKGNPLNWIDRSFETARKRAGLGPDVTFHTLRHTFASWYMMNGGDLYRLQEYMGHSDSKLTKRYAHLSPDYMKAGAQFFGPPKAAGSSGGQHVDNIADLAGRVKPVSH